MASMADLAVYNIKLAAEHLPERFSVTVFLNEILTEPQGRDLETRLAASRASSRSITYRATRRSRNSGGRWPTRMPYSAGWRKTPCPLA